MASFVFNKFKAGLLGGAHSLSAADNTYGVALVKASVFEIANADPDIVTGWDVLRDTWSISSDSENYNSTGYIERGLSGCTTLPNNSTNVGAFDASDITWATSTIDANGCVIFKVSTYEMVCAIDFGTKRSSSNGNFTIAWNTNGIFTLA